MTPGSIRVCNSWLLVALALLAVGLVLGTQDSVTSSELQARQHSLLRVFREDEVTRIEVERGAVRLVLVRTPSQEVDQFRLTEPVEEPARQEKIDALLRSLRFASFLRRVDDQVNRATLGLDQPQWVLHVTVGKIQYRLRLGATASEPPGSHYLELTGEGAPGKGVYVVRAGLVEELAVQATEFRSHELAAIGKDSLKEVRYQRGNVQWHLRGDAGRWRFVDRFSGALVDRDVADAFFLRLARLAFSDFLDPGQARTLLPAEPMRLGLTPRDATRQAIDIELGGTCPGHPDRVVAIRRDPEVVAGCVPLEHADTLEVQPQQLLATRLFDLRLDEVEAFQLERAGTTLSLLRIPGGFRMTSPEQGDVDRQLGEQRLRAWLTLEGRPLLEDPPPVRDVSARVQLRGVSDIGQPYREQAVELLGTATDSSLLVKRLVDGVVLEVPRIEPTQLDVSGLLLKRRTLLDLQARELTRIEVTAPNFHQILERSTDAMDLVLPPGLAKDLLLVQSLLDALRSLTALRWVSVEGSAEYGLQQPRVRVDFTVAPAEGEHQSHSLRIGSATSGGFFARLDDGAVFVLARHVVQTFTTWAVERLLLSPDFERCSRIELKVAGEEIALRREGERFVFDRAGAGSDAAVLIEGLRDLRTEAVVHPGAPLPFEGLERPRLELVTRDDSGALSSRWWVGAADVVDGMSIFYLRFAGVDATYAVSRASIQRVLDLL